MADMLTIGTSGVLSSALLLQTAGNNIANVNTPSFAQERVELGSSQHGGVGRQDVVRSVSEFSLRQMRRDTANFTFYEQFVNEAERVDTLFAGTANSIATAMDGFFQRLQSASDDPTSSASRQLVISEAEGMLSTFNTLNSLVLDQGTTINEQLEIFTDEANNLIQNIAAMNKNITGLGVANAASNPNALMNDRDEALRQLAELVEINTLDGDNGEKLVFLNTGQALVLKQGDFNMVTLNGDPDPLRKELRLNLSTNQNLIVQMEAEKVGGKIGGLLTFRQEVLEPTQNKLGQVALALTDAFNEQNRLGMDADGQLGVNLFELPSAGGDGYAANTGTGGVTARVEPGKGSELTASNILVTYDGANVRIEPLDEDGGVIETTTIAVGAFPATLNAASAASGSLYGLEFTLTAGMNAGDKFLIKPTANASSSLKLATERPEDIALASPIRTEANLTNVGTSSISEGVVFDTDTTTSNFTVNPATNTNSLGTNPLYVRYTNTNEFSFYNVDPVANPAAVAFDTSTFATADYKNVMRNSTASAAFGYDFNITGTPAIGDVYTVRFNDGGFQDNRNGLQLADMQNKDLMRKNVESTSAADNTLTFHEAYARIVASVGEKTAQARTNEKAFDSLLEQSSGWYLSISGVNLDEEAANLVKFQQSYSAAARVISVAQQTFDVLLSSVR